MNDQELIKNLGGVANVAKLTGYSIQRVQNWIYRGIPSKVKLEHSLLFLNQKNQ